VRVLEQTASVGARWRRHYDRLHLHTTREMSSLPGLEIPREFGRWVSRDNLVRYLQLYVDHHGLDIELATTVERIDHAGVDYRVTTSKGAIDARFVIVAGGYNNVPYTPTWPGCETFTGELAHSQEYKNGARYKGKRVLVVGTGNSGAEIAIDLVEHGADVSWSVRTPPTILRREVLGFATQTVGVALQPLPPAIVDPIIKAFGRLTVGDLSRFGLPQPARGAYERALRDRVLPILDVGLVALIRAGRVRPVATIRAFDAASVELVDGQRVTPDAVIACTGYRPALEPIVGHLDVLDRDGRPLVSGGREHETAPRVFFIGYTEGVTGCLREIAADARRVADAIARRATKST
jgi:cation diffusion facilitator CzcD-associated flavoprotein CzcO